ncbi:MAG TPA: sigma-70 family RNA polymerase sigma factor [Candidatus Elarobacter sp.]|jgi:RNA polymerase sigma factor for flagellar operon FliA|nr:sigma-70 family RNA polymerase sigma factor [Candidatus Elarobacter sp.]
MSDALRETLACELLPIVRQIARRVQRMVPSADLDDLIGDGSLGILRALDAYDAARGVSLETYARRVILGAILNGVRRMDPVSERMRRTIRVAERTRYALAQELGTLPTPREMERRVPGLYRARVQATRRIPLSLDAPLPIGGEQLELDLAADPQQIVLERLKRERIHAAIDALPPRQRDVVLGHYFAERHLRILAESLGISPQRVSQLHLMAIDRLRADLGHAG